MADAAARIAQLEAENAALRDEVERLRPARSAQEQQTALAEILRVIATSPGDSQRALETILASAIRLGGAFSGRINRLDGDTLRLAVRLGPLPEPHTLEQPTETPLSRSASMIVQAVSERRSVHLEDVALDALQRQPERAAQLLRTWGHRTGLAIPLLGPDGPLGVISLARATVNPFTQNEIRVLETFADQAVIAIENARLFEEFRPTRTRSLLKRWSSRLPPPRFSGSSRRHLDVLRARRCGGARRRSPLRRQQRRPVAADSEASDGWGERYFRLIAGGKVRADAPAGRRDIGRSSRVTPSGASLAGSAQIVR